jgi:NAD(P)H-nitrite reductase large subunit
VYNLTCRIEGHLQKGDNERKTYMDEELIICRCEEITKEEIVDAIRKGARSISAVKRRTGAGKGLCQGKSCGRLVARILNEEIGIPIRETIPATYRPPIRPIPVSDLGGVKIDGAND